MFNFNIKAMIYKISIDVGIPIAMYYFFKLIGKSDIFSLVIGGCVSFLLICWEFIKYRRLDFIALLTMLLFLVGLILIYITGDPRSMLFKHSIKSIIIGLVLILTSFCRNSFAIKFIQSILGDFDKKILERSLKEDALLRRKFINISIICGSILILEALLRIPLVFMIPLPIMVILGPIMSILTFFIVIKVGIYYTRQTFRNIFNVCNWLGQG